MEVSVKVIALGNTSAHEVAQLTDELEDTVDRLRGVEGVVPVEIEAAPGAKGIGEAVGQFLVNIPGGLVSGLIDLLKAVISRPSQAQVQIKLTAGSVDLSFTPNQIDLAQLAAFIAAIQPKGASD